MKRIILFLSLIALPSFAQDLTVIIQTEAKKCTTAFTSGDYDTFAYYTHPRVIAGMGGKTTMINALKNGMAQMKTEGVSFDSVEIGTPKPPQKIGTWLVTLVPQKLFMKLPGGRLLQESHMVAISEDHGLTWRFIDLSPHLEKVFPELDGKITLPKRPPPTFLPN